MATIQKKEPPKSELIKVEALRAFFVDYTKAERSLLKHDDIKGRSFVGATKRINTGEICNVDRGMAVRLQDAGAVKIII